MEGEENGEVNEDMERGRRDKEKGGGDNRMKDKGRECVCWCVCAYTWVSRILIPRAATTPSDIPVLFLKGRKGNNGEEGPVTLGPQHYSTAPTRISLNYVPMAQTLVVFRSLSCCIVAVLTEVCYKYLATVTRTATNLQPHLSCPSPWLCFVKFVLKNLPL